MKEPKIKTGRENNSIDAIRAAALTKSEITVESVISRVNALADGAQSDRDRLKALELLGRHLGAFLTDKDLVGAMTPQQLEELAQRMLDKVNGQQQAGNL